MSAEDKMDEIEYFDHIELTVLTVETVAPLLKVVRPAWDIATVQMKPLNKGNHPVFLCIIINN